MGNTLTIAQAHDKLRTKQCSSSELVQACIDRIESVDPTVNAVVYKNFERALNEAKKIDSAGDFSHPLAGIPYLTKDVYCEKGIPTTACSNILRAKDYVPPFDSTTTARLKASGAISIGKSNTDEFTMGASTETSCYGTTRCPWDTSRVAGGSSGGSAAGVAADECLFALGTDTGGSIRQPASFCGCTGLRVTYGRTSRYGVMSMASSLDTIGPLCKSIEDIAIVLGAIAGKDPLDATTADVPVPDYRAALTGNIKGMKLGLPKEYFIDGMHAETEAAVRATTEVFESLGATVEEISLPHTAYATPTYYIICPSEVSSNMARFDGIRYGHTVENAENLVEYYKDVRSDGFGPEVKRRIMIGTYALSAGYFDAYYRQAQKVRTLILQDFTTAFKSVDAIIAPVAPNPAFTVGAHENDPVAMYLEDIFLDSQVMAGIPALSVPCGFSKEHLPIGLQIMGPQWQEENVLKIAHAYEQATTWHTAKPSL
ncbi:Asp-tRNA(Asn)/Glu-tRNA(Gln) amidotransferase GatCAB subunit A [Candidatus Peregrinibacteria bacterium CG10_big_fil_rev_8_21_14_0_10_49_24]|nr:MAG: Asp-tRNA(Asn)/Glu-tRNA(Gln) amidotransferase GatCAB subunit A [Candidatus Peregrinibacteria bacterium CG11_big_fil_rev_8_21_14_0_20_49_14]PIR50622.1 MAG: Asp-tRNA(Asn)/Glu-tRNA(Gln) amidotransferase GatCAB subunit A [Candidatus Peregrinibacteria bacterium CG10_big_fil_rev_8_21_14_0_10_49_24]PJA67060.1 MAG: Asp-tRNA(Asn)/Glu-tRNA(Gln) amidotransferase GatCAB subunit A [Candidatus Peregrinibacteria bacterium CG_4_9_14_3_um_filter_49_12]